LPPKTSRNPIPPLKTGLGVCMVDSRFYRRESQKCRDSLHIFHIPESQNP